MRRTELLNTLDNLIRLLVKRSTGKTTLLKRGADGYESDFILITRTAESSRHITLNPRCKPYPLRSIERVRGFDLPLLIDHEVLREIFVDSYHQLANMESELETQRLEFDQFKNRVSDLEMACLNHLILVPWWKFKAKRDAKLKVLQELNKYYQITKSNGKII